MRRKMFCMVLVVAMMLSISSFAFADSEECLNSTAPESTIGIAEGDVAIDVADADESEAPRIYWSIYDTVRFNEGDCSADAEVELICLEEAGTSSGFIIYSVGSVDLSIISGWGYMEDMGSVISKQVSMDGQSVECLIQFKARRQEDASPKTYQAHITARL